MLEYEQLDQPHSEAGHNPYWCGGDMNGICCGDDPCWSCIQWLHAEAIAFHEMSKIINS